MIDIVEDIIKFRFLINIDPIGKEVDKEQFEDFLSSWPRVSTYNYSNATVWRSPWLGKMKWIAMQFIHMDKYFILDDIAKMDKGEGLQNS